MKIELRVFATYRKPVAEVLGQDTQEEIFLDIPSGSTLGHLLEIISLEKEMALIALVNGIREEHDYVLSPNDRVGLFPPVGGG